MRKFFLLIFFFLKGISRIYCANSNPEGSKKKFQLHEFLLGPNDFTSLQKEPRKFCEKGNPKFTQCEKIQNIEPTNNSAEEKKEKDEKEINSPISNEKKRKRKNSLVKIPVDDEMADTMEKQIKMNFSEEKNKIEGDSKLINTETQNSNNNFVGEESSSNCSLLRFLFNLTIPSFISPVLLENISEYKHTILEPKEVNTTNKMNETEFNENINSFIKIMKSFISEHRLDRKYDEIHIKQCLDNLAHQIKFSERATDISCSQKRFNLSRIIYFVDCSTNYFIPLKEVSSPYQLIDSIEMMKLYILLMNSSKENTFRSEAPRLQVKLKRRFQEFEKYEDPDKFITLCKWNYNFLSKLQIQGSNTFGNLIYKILRNTMFLYNENNESIENNRYDIFIQHSVCLRHQIAKMFADLSRKMCKPRDANSIKEFEDLALVLERFILEIKELLSELLKRQNELKENIYIVSKGEIRMIRVLHKKLIRYILYYIVVPTLNVNELNEKFLISNGIVQIMHRFLSASDLLRLSTNDSDGFIEKKDGREIIHTIMTYLKLKFLYINLKKMLYHIEIIFLVIKESGVLLKNSPPCSLIKFEFRSASLLLDYLESYFGLINDKRTKGLIHFYNHMELLNICIRDLKKICSEWTGDEEAEFHTAVLEKINRIKSIYDNMNDIQSCYFKS